MFKKILFATTASAPCDNAAQVAFDLAKKYEADLNVFHVFGTPTRSFSTRVVDNRTGEEDTYDADYVNWVNDEMRSYYAKHMEKAGTVTFDAVVGVPHREVLRKARQDDVDLIVVGAHSREESSGATRYRAVVGSTMQRIAKGAKCPVLIVSRPCTTCLWYFTNIIFGTDFSKASDSAFQFAYNLCKMIGAKMYIFHALDVASSGVVLEQDEIEKKIEEAKKKIDYKYVSQMKDYDNVEVAVWEGVPYVEILKYSRDKNADLIIMSHHTRNVDPENALLGSTVEQVVLRSSCPVASVNRPGKVGGADTE